ncbi:MAG: YdeI/OmpD-associated family protein [Gemmatimonadaceae bacterium]|nr:YdeI/OmpD-associated family protein [Gemmatimonadaceae bacterium]
MASPRFFTSAAQFRAWLKAHHDSSTELVVGFYRVNSGQPHMTWTEAVREALCFGWIDGLVKSLDETRYTRRFTPRKARSVWSAVNIRHVRELLAEGRMEPAGIAAFEARPDSQTHGYSLKTRSTVMPEPFAGILQRHRSASKFWESQPASYRQATVYWVVTAKQEATRQRRLQSLIEHSTNGERIPQFVSPTGKSTNRKRGTSA